MKKILMISFFFPPIGVGGVQRNLRYARHLSRFGWEPTIITSKFMGYCAVEYKDFQDISSKIEVCRTYYPNWGWLFKRPFFWRFYKAFIFSFPDEKNLWFFPAFYTGLNLIWKKKIDVIYSTSAPYTSHLIGLALHIVTRKPLVVDCRDEWSENLCLEKLSFLQKIFHSILEKIVFKHARRIIFVVEEMAEFYRKKYKDYFDVKKIVTITNGYDENDFVKTEEVLERDTRKMIFTYAGTVHDIEPFLRSVRELLMKNKIPSGSIKINIIGDFKNYIYLKDKTLENIIFSTLDFVPHTESIKCIVNSDVLVINLKGTRMAYSGKLFEYLRAQREILAIVEPDTAIVKFLKELNYGTITNIDSQEDICEKIIQLHNKWEKGELNKLNILDKIKKYESKVLTKQLADTLNKLWVG
jgi:glycosyltransferase involved in cell wall biosynthesis